MGYYWQIVPRDHEPILVTEERAKIAMQRIARGETHLVMREGAFPTLGMRIEPTEQVVSADNSHLVESGHISVLPHNVLTRINEDGVEVVRWKWAKKTINPKHWSVGYYKLANDYERVVVGFKLPLTENQVLPSGVEFVTNPLDIERLDYLASTGH